MPSSQQQDRTRLSRSWVGRDDVSSCLCAYFVCIVLQSECFARAAWCWGRYLDPNCMTKENLADGACLTERSCGGSSALVAHFLAHTCTCLHEDSCDGSWSYRIVTDFDTWKAIRRRNALRLKGRMTLWWSMVVGFLSNDPVSMYHSQLSGTCGGVCAQCMLLRPDSLTRVHHDDGRFRHEIMLHVTNGTISQTRLKFDYIVTTRLPAKCLCDVR